MGDEGEERKGNERTNCADVTRDAIHRRPALVVVGVIMEEILGLAIVPMERLASSTPTMVILQPSPIPLPHSLDIRNRPATASRPETSLDAIQRAAPCQLGIDAVIRVRAMLCEAGVRVRVREDMATVTLPVWVQAVVVVQVRGLLRGEVDLKR